MPIPASAPMPPQRDHRARQHPQPGAAPRPAPDRHQPAPHAGAGLLAGIARDDDLAAGHARARTGIGGPQPGAGVAGDAQHAAGHLGARPVAGVAAHLDLAAAHPGAEVIAAPPLHQHPAARPSRRRSRRRGAGRRHSTSCSSAAPDTSNRSPTATVSRPQRTVSAATSDGAEPLQPLGDRGRAPSTRAAGADRRVRVSVTAGRAAPRAGSGIRRACRRSWRR